MACKNEITAKIEQSQKNNIVQQQTIAFCFIEIVYAIILGTEINDLG